MYAFTLVAKLFIIHRENNTMNSHYYLFLVNCCCGSYVTITTTKIYYQTSRPTILTYDFDVFVHSFQMSEYQDGTVI